MIQHPPTQPGSAGNRAAGLMAEHPTRPGIRQQNRMLGEMQTPLLKAIAAAKPAPKVKRMKRRKAKR